MLVLGTMGAPPRRLLGRRGRPVERAEPAVVPTARATLVRPEPFASREEAGAWLDGLRADRDRAGEELALAATRLNRALHAHRVAAADPYVPAVTVERALVARLGYGSGPALADGEFESAFELPGTAPQRPRRSMEAPDERFAALIGARTQALACEELLLRARADVDGSRLREAALQARVGLEALLAELPAEGALARSRGELEELRKPVGDAANAALRGELSNELGAALRSALDRMEAVVRRHRLGA